MECLKSDNVCDDNLDYVTEYNCFTCNNADEVCTSCNTNLHFELSSDGICECEVGFEISGNQCIA